MRAEPAHIFGHPLTLELAPATADWIRQRWSAPCSRRGGRPLHIREAAVRWDEGLESFECSVFDSTLRFQFTADGFTLRLGDALLHAALYGETFTLSLCGDPQAAPTLLWGAVPEVVRLGGLLPFHAAGLAQAGRCAVLMGPSGTGKSTTLVSAVLAGYQPLAEDMLWVDPDSLNVYGNDCEIRLWPDSLERFKLRLPTARQRASDGKFVVPLDALPGYPPGDCTLCRLVVLRRDLSQASAWEPVPELELVRALWESGCVPLHPQARKLAEKGIAALCRKVRFEGLRIGATPLDFAPLLS